jgi:hypothetical protein
VECIALWGKERGRNKGLGVLRRKNTTEVGQGLNRLYVTWRMKILKTACVGDITPTSKSFSELCMQLSYGCIHAARRRATLNVCPPSLHRYVSLKTCAYYAYLTLLKSAKQDIPMSHMPLNDSKLIPSVICWGKH